MHRSKHTKLGETYFAMQFNLRINISLVLVRIIGMLVSSAC